MLKVDHIYKTFNPGTINEKTALNGTTLTLNEGDFVTVIGGNGAGKSTLLNAIAGVFLVDEGSISIDDVDVRAQTCQFLRTRIPGSYDGNCCYHGNR